MTAAFAVARYTMTELSRRRILLVFFIIGAAGLLIFGVGFRVLYSYTSAGSGFVTTNLPPDVFNRILELQFLSYLYGALSTFALLIAFGIGMTAIYHDLESGAAVSIFSKPVTRFGFAAGKVAAAVTSLIVIVGLLAVEARLVMLLFPGAGLEGSLTGQVIATTANTLLLMLLVLALSTWMNNIVAAIVAFIYYNVITGVIVGVHSLFQSGAFDNPTLKAISDILYWTVPHALVSSAPGDLVRAQVALSNAPPGERVVAIIPQASGFGDIVWWAFLMVLFAGLVYLAVRRKQV
jgi:ABC-type transport system involved in multi-copper enzyme maturation permease subunit